MERKKAYYRLKNEREQAKLTQEDMEKMLGLSAMYYSKKERALYPFTIEEAKMIRDKINETRKQRGLRAISIDILFE